MLFMDALDCLNIQLSELLGNQVVEGFILGEYKFELGLLIPFNCNLIGVQSVQVLQHFLNGDFGSFICLLDWKE
jgi:hypothetical protein